MGKPQIRVAYFGDHYWSDVLYGGSFLPPARDQQSTTKWDSIAVMEELYYEHDPASRRVFYPQSTSPSLIDTRPFWGPNYFLDGSRRNYFVAEAERVARYAIPFARTIQLLARL